MQIVVVAGLESVLRVRTRREVERAYIIENPLNPIGTSANRAGRCLDWSTEYIANVLNNIQKRLMIVSTSILTA